MPGPEFDGVESLMGFVEEMKAERGSASVGGGWVASIASIASSSEVAWWTDVLGYM
jgi:hypothetical protein